MSMTPEEYQGALLTVAAAARTLLPVDVPDLLQRIERAHSFGCMLDPTLYREKVAAMDQDKEMLEAALPLWRWVKAMEQRAHAQAEKALDAVVAEERKATCSCGGTFERQGVGSGTCGTVWGPPTCVKCGAILAEGGA